MDGDDRNLLGLLCPIARVGRECLRVGNGCLGRMCRIRWGRVLQENRLFETLFATHNQFHVHL